MSSKKNQKFTKLFKFLFTDETYKNMKSKTKLLYAILTERQSLSVQHVKNNKNQSQFLDENKRLFSIYSNTELKNMINVSEPTIINLKKELVEYNLLEEVRVANSSNRLYPKKPYDEYFYENDLDEFYRLPHSLFDNDCYKSLSADSIIAYSIYLSRYEYSIYKNHFYDKDQNIYCIFTNEELADLLNVDRRKIAKIKNELISCKLLTVKPSNRADYLYLHLPETSDSKELKKMHIGNLKKCTLGTKENAHWELKKMHTSNTDLSNTDLSNTDYKTTTKNEMKSKTLNEKESGGSFIQKNIESKLLDKIENEYQINLTRLYTQKLTALFKQLPFDVIEYGIEYSSIKAKDPKKYLLSVLDNWIKGEIKTLEQAQAFKQSQITSKPTESKEMTPKWLEERKNNEYIEPEQTAEELEALEKDRQAFLERIKGK